MVKLSKPSIHRFKEQTKFQITKFSELYENFKDAAAKTKDGELNKETFCSVAKGIFATDQHELLDAIFEYLDLDDSQTIDAGELLCALNIFCAGNASDKVKVCFAAFDLDNNGVLNREEFRNMLHTTLVTSRDLLIDLLGHFAEDDDPMSVQTITLQTLKVDEVEIMADACFDEADENNDGEIELHEFTSWAERQTNMVDFFSTFDKLFAHAEPQDVLQSAPGSVGAAAGVSDDDAAVAASARESIEEKAGKQFMVFEPVQVSTQTVAGTNYFFKILVGEDDYIHARVFKDLPHNNSAISCHSVQLNKSLEDDLVHF